MEMDSDIGSQPWGDDSLSPGFNGITPQLLRDDSISSQSFDGYFSFSTDRDNFDFADVFDQHVPQSNVHNLMEMDSDIGSQPWGDDSLSPGFNGITPQLLRDDSISSQSFDGYFSSSQPVGVDAMSSQSFGGNGISSQPLGVDGISSSSADVQGGGEAKSQHQTTTKRKTSPQKAPNDKLYGKLRCKLPYLRTFLQVLDDLPSPHDLSSSLTSSNSINMLPQRELDTLKLVLAEFCSEVVEVQHSKEDELHCSFLSAVAGTTIGDAKILREQLVQKMIDMGPETFKFVGENWDSYTKELEKSTKPCDINMALAAAAHFNREIVIVPGDDLPMKLSPPRDGAYQKRFPVIVGRLMIDGQHRYFATCLKESKSGFLSGSRFNIYADAYTGQTNTNPELPPVGQNITMATSGKYKSKYGHGDSFQIRINKEYVREHFSGILNFKNMQNEEVLSAAKTSLREVINYSMVASGHYYSKKAGDKGDNLSDASLSEEYPAEEIIQHKVNLLRLGVDWETFRNWADEASNFPVKLLFSLAGVTIDECSTNEEQYKSQGLETLKNGIERFFTSPLAENETLTSSKTFMHKCLAFIKDKYTDFKARNKKKGEETYEKELDRNDPLESLVALDERETRSKLFVLIFCLIQRGNISRIFGDMNGAKKYLDHVDELLRRHRASSAQHGGLPPHLETLWREISDNETDSALSELDYKNLSIRLRIVQSQLVRQVASNEENKGGWNTKKLIELLHSIKIETRGLQGYEISNRLVRFQELMCRLYAAQAMCINHQNSNATSGAAKSASISLGDIRDLAIKDLEDLEREYDEVIKLARVGNDDIKEYFSVLHQHFIKAELLKFNLKLGKITPEDATLKWKAMLDVRKQVLGIGHRHTIYAQYQYGNGCKESGLNLDIAIKEIESAMQHQKDEGWKVVSLIPTYANLCLKRGKKLRQAKEKVEHAIRYLSEKKKRGLPVKDKDMDKLKKLLVDLQTFDKKRKREQSQDGRNTKQKRNDS